MAGLVNKPVTVSINHPANNIRFMVYQYDGTGELTDSTGEVTGTITNSNCFAQIYIPSAAVGQAFDHVKVYPMIRLATDADPTYQPYAKTNLELTDALTPTTGTFTYAGKTFYYASYEDKIVIRCDTTLPTADLPAASWTTLASAESVPNKLGHNAFGVLHRDDGTIMGIYVSTTGLVQAKIITAGTNASSNLQDTAILC